MKHLLLSYKKQVIIGGLIMVLIALLISLFITSQVEFAPKSEPVPAGRIHDAGVFGADVIIHDSNEGEVIIAPSDDGNLPAISLTSAEATTPVKLVNDPEKIWTEDTYAGNHTPVEKVEMADDSIGVLTIEKIGLSVNVYKSPDTMEDMTKGVAHFSGTSAWIGNVGLSAHNINFDGSDGYFKNLYTLVEGDAIQYKTALGERTYLVSSVKSIDETDWSPLGQVDFNQLTMITCISGQPTKRLCVQASEKMG